MLVNQRRPNPGFLNEEISAPSKQTAKPSKFMLYLASHLRAGLTSLGQLLRARFTSVMTLMVIGIALAFPTALFVFLQNVNQLSANWGNSAQISLFLKMDVSPSQTQALVNQLQQQPGISAVKYISPQQGLAEFANQADVQTALSELKQNPLPGVILVQPQASLQSPEALNQLLQNLKQQPQVDVAQLDLQWINRLYAMVDLSKHLTSALGVLLGLGVLFIIGHTINLSLQKYRREIEIFKLVGATDSFVRRPFLYTGILYGLLGGLLAWLFISLLVWSLQAPALRLANLYGSNFHLQGLSSHAALSLISIGMLLGLIGAWLAVGKHLKTL